MDNFAERAALYRLHLKQTMVAAKDASGMNEVSCKCKYCSDGLDPTHGHMYIHIPSSEDDPSTFYCQKCHSSGLVTNQTLIEWGIYEASIADFLLELNKKAGRKGKSVGFERRIYNIQNNVLDIELANQKLDYIYNRIGVRLTLEQAMQDKIILNLNDVLKWNRITQVTRHPNIINELNRYFVGFLSEDNNFVNLRRICEEHIVYQGIDKRYINYNIFGKKDNTEKFYAIPYQSNIAANPNRIKVHLAEGPFDCLSIKYNLRKTNDDIYIAICGSAYKGLIMHLMNTLRLYYIELHVYPDNDDPGSNWIMEDLANYVRPYMIPMYIHRNTMKGEKDFGNRLDRIKESVQKVL